MKRCYNIVNKKTPGNLPRLKHVQDSAVLKRVAISKDGYLQIHRSKTSMLRGTPSDLVWRYLRRYQGKQLFFSKRYDQTIAKLLSSSASCAQHRVQSDVPDRANFSIVEARGARLRRRPCKSGTRLTQTLGAGVFAALLCCIGWGLEPLNETAASGAAAFSMVLFVQGLALALGAKLLFQHDRCRGILL
jgi:hypothetical protein